MPPVLYLVDASVFIFRAYYSVPIDVVDPRRQPGQRGARIRALPRRPARSANRRGAIAVAFDESLEQSYRNEIYPAYKANREPAPAGAEAPVRAVPRGRARASASREYGSSRYEADDIIGTLAARAQRQAMPVTIVSRDKDLTQLVTPQRHLLGRGR